MSILCSTRTVTDPRHHPPPTQNWPTLQRGFSATAELLVLTVLEKLTEISFRALPHLLTVPPQRGKKHPRLSPQAVEELLFMEITVSVSYFLPCTHLYISCHCLTSVCHTCEYLRYYLWWKLARWLMLSQGPDRQTGELNLCGSCAVPIVYQLWTDFLKIAMVKQALWISDLTSEPPRQIQLLHQLCINYWCVTSLHVLFDRRISVSKLPLVACMPHSRCSSAWRTNCGWRWTTPPLNCPLHRALLKQSSFCLPVSGCSMSNTHTTWSLYIKSWNSSWKSTLPPGQQLPENSSEAGKFKFIMLFGLLIPT